MNPLLVLVLVQAAVAPIAAWFGQRYGGDYSTVPNLALSTAAAALGVRAARRGRP